MSWWGSNRNAESGESCSFTKVRRQRCTTVEDPDTNKPIKKCEKTEQVLKHCLGRPTEIVESKTEYTEEEASEDELVTGRHGFEEHNQHFREYNSSGRNRDDQVDNPFMRIPDFIEGQVAAGMESFLQAAEEMANELFGQFGFHRDAPRDEIFKRKPDEEGEDPDASNFAEYSQGFQEV